MVPIARVDLIDPVTVTDPVVRAVYSEIEQDLGFGIVPNVFRALGGQPAILRAVWDLFRATILHGLLPRTVKEMVAVVVSAGNGSEYALRVHLHSLGVQGITEGVLAALEAGDMTMPGLAPSVVALIGLARKAVQHGPRAIMEADIAAVEATGITRAELAEVFATIDLFHYLNSFTDLARVPIDAI